MEARNDPYNGSVNSSYCTNMYWPLDGSFSKDFLIAGEVIIGWSACYKLHQPVNKFSKMSEKDGCIPELGSY